MSDNKKCICIGWRKNENCPIHGMYRGLNTFVDVNKAIKSQQPQEQSNPTNTEEHKKRPVVQNPKDYAIKLAQKEVPSYGAQQSQSVNTEEQLREKADALLRKIKDSEFTAKRNDVYEISKEVYELESALAGAQRTEESGNTESLIYWREQAIERLQLLKEKEQTESDLRSAMFILHNECNRRDQLLKEKDEQIQKLQGLYEAAMRNGKHLSEEIIEQAEQIAQNERDINTLAVENAQLKEKVAEAWDACHARLLWEFGRSETPAPNKAEYLKTITDKTENP